MQTTRVEISKKALLHNLKQYKTFLNSNLLLCPVLKSNAYGHGIELVGSICQESSLVNGICLASLSEALFLRKRKITKPIFVISIIDDDPAEAILQDIAMIAYDFSFINELNKKAKKLNKKAKIHIKIDTGFSRCGLFAHDAFTLIKKIVSLSHIVLDGIFSHFTCSPADNYLYTYQQYNQLNDLLIKLKTNNITPQHIHITNTASLHHAELNNKCTMTRLGIGMYGLWPSIKSKKHILKKFPHFSLQQVLTWKTKIIQVKTIPANSFVGYDLTYKTDKQIMIGLLPVGYWDGYDPKLSNCGVVKIGNYDAPVIGRISMNLTVIDVTHIPTQLLVNDVVLLGNFPNITADNFAQKVGTINYEVVTRINPLIPRILVK